MITEQGIYTGLLGYSRRKEFIGSSLNYRDTEVFQFEVGVTDFNNLNDVSAYIEQTLRQQFSSFSGDINIKTIGVSADQSNDHIRIARYNSTVELRSVNGNLASDYPELTGDYYYGVNPAFFSSYYDVIDSISETFDFSDSTNGNKSYNHNLSLSIRSGDGLTAKTLAQNIANTVFTNSETGTRYGINVFESALNQYGAASGVVTYAETYDLFANSYSFSKQKEILPQEVADKSYTYSLRYVLETNEKGIVSVSEQGDIISQIDYPTAKAAYQTLIGGAFARCADKYSKLNYLIGSKALINVPIEKRSSHNKPARSVSYDTKYTNDPLTKSNGYEEEETITISRQEESTVDISHQYNYTVLGNSSINLESTVLPILVSKKATSPARCQSVYAASEFYRSDWLGGQIANISTKYKSSVRGRSYSATFDYSNSPIYITSLPLLGASDVTNFKSVSIKISDDKPSDVINEYKIINKSDSRSILSYAYQSSEGSRSVTYDAQLARPSNNVLYSPYLPADAIAALFQDARFKITQHFVNTNSLKISYFLSDLKYSFDNNNKVTLNAQLTYTDKRQPTP